MMKHYITSDDFGFDVIKCEKTSEGKISTNAEHRALYIGLQLAEKLPSTKPQIIACIVAINHEPPLIIRTVG